MPAETRPNAEEGAHESRPPATPSPTLTGDGPCSLSEDLGVQLVKEDFSKRYGGKAATAAANSLTREFGSKLKERMQYCIDHPEEISKLTKVKAQVSEVKGVMMENIEKVLDRGPKSELVIEPSDVLELELKPDLQLPSNKQSSERN
ncbi:hypothetical protein ZIOFF_006594 [Zingiber officinale]|uniref:V-SNARE coiled-coil homology domain-containing protein n=1 Tax=Zingiber officinale TaxID=94328 RepID=A0A8J5IEL7_ZINOF|nr:hypothetical protein ZIOFF_006594 [Zingiber officinale]